MTPRQTTIDGGWMHMCTETAGIIDAPDSYFGSGADLAARALEHYEPGLPGR